MPERRTPIKPLAFALVWAIVIFLLCNMHLDTSGEASWYYFEGIDKVVHAGLFFILGILSYWGLSEQKRWRSVSRNAGWYALLLCIVYGGIIEVLQGTIFTYRSADWVDWLFDIGGTLAGLWVFRQFRKKYFKGHETRSD